MPLDILLGASISFFYDFLHSHKDHSLNYSFLSRTRFDIAADCYRSLLLKNLPLVKSLHVSVSLLSFVLLLRSSYICFTVIKGLKLEIIFGFDELLPVLSYLHVLFDKFIAYRELIYSQHLFIGIHFSSLDNFFTLLEANFNFNLCSTGTLEY
jgi:hypothetical protein